MLKTFLSQEKISKIRQTFKTIFETGKDIKKEPSMPKEQLRLFISKAAQNNQEVILQTEKSKRSAEQSLCYIHAPMLFFSKIKLIILWDIQSELNK